jgi:GNAT superfamily N-acetyltransferase
MTHFTIRLAANADLPAMLALYAHLNPDDPPADEAKAKTGWATLLASPLVNVFVAESEGVIVSSAPITIVPNVTRGVRPYALIDNVVTHAAHRRRGLGQAALAAALAAAWDAGSYKVMPATGYQEPETLLFYERAGFRRGGKTLFEARHPSA